MSPPGSLLDDSRDVTYDAWCLHTVNLFQAVIGVAYGLIEVNGVAIVAKQLREPATPRERSHAREVVFESLSRKMPKMSACEALHTMELANEFSKTCCADITKIIGNLRRLLHLGGPTIAEHIRDTIDREYATNQKEIVRKAASHFGMTGKKAKAEFERRFGVSVADYTTAESCRGNSADPSWNEDRRRSRRGRIQEREAALLRCFPQHYRDDAERLLLQEEASVTVRFAPPLVTAITMRACAQETGTDVARDMGA